jgi:Ca2+-binding EF-hand superfamily protein
MDKENNENLTEVGLQAYYKELGRKEKSELIRYLMVEFNYSYNSIQQKLTGKANFNKRDLILIGYVVKSELWRS